MSKGGKPDVASLAFPGGGRGDMNGNRILVWNSRYIGHTQMPLRVDVNKYHAVTTTREVIRPDNCQIPVLTCGNGRSLAVISFNQASAYETTRVLRTRRSESEEAVWRNLSFSCPATKFGTETRQPNCPPNGLLEAFETYARRNNNKSNQNITDRSYGKPVGEVHNNTGARHAVNIRHSHHHCPTWVKHLPVKSSTIHPQHKTSTPSELVSTRSSNQGSQIRLTQEIKELQDRFVKARRAQSIRFTVKYLTEFKIDTWQRSQPFIPSDMSHHPQCEVKVERHDGGKPDLVPAKMHNTLWVPNDNIDWSQSKTWESEEQQERKHWGKIAASFKHSGFDQSPFVPLTFEDLLKHKVDQADYLYYAQLKVLYGKEHETERSRLAFQNDLAPPAGATTHVRVSEKLKAIVNKDGLSAVTMRPSIWLGPDFRKDTTCEDDQVDWPEYVELKTHGDDLAKQGVGRYLPPPRLRKLSQGLAYTPMASDQLPPAGTHIPWYMREVAYGNPAVDGLYYAEAVNNPEPAPSIELEECNPILEDLLTYIRAGEEFSLIAEFRGHCDISSEDDEFSGYHQDF